MVRGSRSGRVQWFAYCLLILTLWNFSIMNATEAVPTERENTVVTEFSQWFVDQGGYIGNIRVASFKEMGRGFAVDGRISEGDKILHIPSDIIFSRRNMHNHLDNEKRSVMESLPPEQSIIAWLLLEQASPLSKFRPYLDVLPTYVPSLLHFTAEDLKHLQNKELAEEADDLQKSVLKDYQQYMETVSSSGIWPANVPTTTKDEYIWAVTMLNSRGLRFQGEVYMAPMADIFNYQPHPVTRDARSGDFFLKHHVLDDFGGITVYADRDHSHVPSNRAQSQVLEDYGDNPDEIYLKYHGFVPDSNPFRCVKISVDKFPSLLSGLTDMQKQLLAALGFKRPPSKCVDKSGVLGRGLEVFFTVLSFNEQEGAKCLVAIEQHTMKNLPVVFAECAFDSVANYLNQIRTGSNHSLYGMADKIRKRGLNSISQDSRSTLQERVLARTQIVLDGVIASYSYPTTIEKDEFVSISLQLAMLKAEGSVETSLIHQHLSVKYRLLQKNIWLSVCTIYGAVCHGLLSVNDGVDTNLPHSSSNIVPTAASSPPSILSMFTAISSFLFSSNNNSNSLINASPSTTGIAEKSRNTPLDTTASTTSDAGLKTAAGSITLPRPQKQESFTSSVTNDITVPIQKKAEDAAVPETKPPPMSLEQKVAVFNNWFRALGPAPMLLEARVLPMYRIGTVTTRAIEKDEYYLGVPANRFGVMDANVALMDSSVSPLIQLLVETYTRRDDFHELLFFLLNEAFVRREESAYWPYLSLLPTLDEMDIPLLWSNDDLKSRLGPSHITDLVLKYHETTSNKFNALKKMDMITRFFSGGVFTYDNYRWATAILDSRSIWWQGKRHLVPMLDFVNCREDAGDPTRLHSTELDAREEYAMTRAGRSYGAGEQLFENYGQPNHIYFVYHGFTLPDNYHDCVHLELPLSESDLARIDTTKAKQLFERLRLSMVRASTLSTCLSYPIPHTVWAFYALKTNSYKQLSDQELLGRPNPEGMGEIIGFLTEQINLYNEFDRSSHARANELLDSELALLKSIRTQLTKDHRALTADINHNNTGRDRQGNAKTEL